MIAWNGLEGLVAGALAGAELGMVRCFDSR